MARTMNMCYLWYKIRAEERTELGTLNPECLIRISYVDTFHFLLNPLIFGYSTEESKTGFSKLRDSLLFLYIKWRAKSQISRLLIGDSDWLNFKDFQNTSAKLGLSRD